MSVNGFTLDDGVTIEQYNYEALENIPTLAEAAQPIIETYAGSTLAGTAQSVKSAIDTLNSKVDSVPNYGVLKRELMSSDDLNNIFEAGFYYVGTSIPANVPVNTEYNFLLVFGQQISGSRNWSFQVYASGGRNLYYRRCLGGANAVWSNWTKITGTEVTTS